MGWAARARRRTTADEGPFPAAVAAQKRATRQLLGQHGLTPDGVLEVAANAHAFSATMTAVAAVKTEPRPACADGCSWCCERPVAATPIDVFYAAEAVAALPPERLESVRARVDAAGARHAALSDRELLVLRDPCPLLEEGRCAIYDARPAACVGRNSADAEACRSDVEHGRATAFDQNRVVAFIPARLVHAAGEAIDASLHDLRLGPRAARPRLRFVPALRAALDAGVHESLRRWLADERAFADLPRVAGPPST